MTSLLAAHHLHLQIIAQEHRRPPQVVVASLVVLEDIPQGAVLKRVLAVLIQQLMEPLRGQFRHPQHVVGAGLIELRGLLGIVCGDDHVGVGPDLPCCLHQAFIGDALQQRVGDRGDHNAWSLVLRLAEHLGRGNVAASALQAQFAEFRHDVFVEVDDVERPQEFRCLSLELCNQHKGDLVETEEHDLSVLILLTVTMRNGGRAPQGLLHDTGDPGVEHVVVLDHQSAGNAQDREDEDHDLQGFLVDMAVRHTEGANHEGKLPELREVDRRDACRPGVAAERPCRKEDANPASQDEHQGDEDAEDDIDELGHWEHHPHSGKEQDEEEVADVLDLAVEVGAVRESAQRRACDKRGDLHWKADDRQDGTRADEETPRERQDQHELDTLRSVKQHGGHHELRVEQRTHDQDPDHGEGLDNAHWAGSGDIGLKSQHNDSPNVLAQQHSHAEPAGDRVQLALLAQQLDHDHRRRQRRRDAAVHRGIVASAEVHARLLESHEDERRDEGADRKLQEPSDDGHLAHLE
mmetsp:Transcript_135233/g.337363  ORF Transcript_135233/g.337363 Transcript_135233/m.337363 type:complete len:521 (-) Transcript_135233:140-1702(-)